MYSIAIRDGQRLGLPTHEGPIKLRCDKGVHQRLRRLDRDRGRRLTAASGVGAEVEELAARLDPTKAERVVLSALLVPAEEGWALSHASLLIGPSAMGRLSWSDWVRHEGGQEFALLPAGMKGAFAVKRKTFLLARESLTVLQAKDWLQGALVGKAPAIRHVPEAAASLSPTRAPSLARPGNATPASSFVNETERPVTGFLFPADASAVALPDSLTVDGHTVRPASLIGIDLPTKQPRVLGEPAPAGVLFGRLTRRAWMARITYERDAELLNLWLRLENADPYELELEIREYVGDDLADCRRLRLADIPLPARARRRFAVRLPTLGRAVRRSIALYGRGGELLDERVGFNFVESVKMSMSVNGAPAHTITVGEKRPAPTAIERLADVRRVEESYEWWLGHGAKRRIISGRDATRLLQRRLKQAKDELLIIDSYFGGQPTDWDILKDVAPSVPVRVLTGWKAQAPPTQLPNVDARKWGTKVGDIIPYHDRFYLWGTTGLNVGTSPNGLSGTRAFRISELSVAEVKALRAAFEEWWLDKMATPL